MVVDIPGSFSNEDRLAFESWLNQNYSQLPDFANINGTLYRVIGVYDDQGNLISVRVAN